MKLAQGSKSLVIAAFRRCLPRRVRRALFHLAFNIEMEEFQLFAYRYAYAPVMYHTLRALRDRGIEPATIVDVGAYAGTWSQLAHAVWPGAHIIMIEPQSSCTDQLTRIARQVGADLHSELLGAVDGACVMFNVMQSGSSVFAELSNIPRRAELRTVHSLDTLLGAANIDLLKIDAEGYELEILRGSMRSLRHVHIVLLEVSLIATNAGAPLIHDVLAFMHGIGFVAYDIAEFHRRPLDRALNKIDLVFVRENSPVRVDRRHSSGEES